jgi:poly-D-alanine transfer protein DltD
LVPALVALSLAACLVAGFDVYARTVEDRYVHALAPDMFHQKSLGNAIQKATLRQPDLLPMYGSSEMRADNTSDGAALFDTYPTGFNVSRIGFELQSLLCVTLQLAGDGSLLRGKKVVLIADRGTVLEYGGNWEDNFSALAAKELVFSSDLTYGLKQRIAGEMAKSPQLLSKDPLLEFATERLAGASLADRAAYFAVFPLGKLSLWIMRLQDHWEVLAYIRGQKELQAAVQRIPAALDWPGLVARASAQDAKESDNNVFHINNVYWNEHKNDLPRVDTTGPNLRGRNPPGPNLAGPNLRGPNSPGAKSPGPNLPGPNSPGPNSAGPNPPGPDSPGASFPGPGSTSPGSAGANGKRITSDAAFVRSTLETPWNQLELTLAELQELGAQTLLVGIPLNGRYFDYWGVSKTARATYYDKLSQLGRKYGAKVVTFQDHEYDRYFFYDFVGDHASVEGWVYIDQALDEFYHGTLR